MRIRRSHPGDWPGLKQACVPGIGKADDWEPADVWWAGYEGSTPVCFAAATMVRGSVYLLRAGVEPSYRGHGYQARLIRARVAWGRTEGAQYAWACTSPENAASMRSLMRCGFKPWRPRWAEAGWVYWRRDILNR